MTTTLPLQVKNIGGDGYHLLTRISVNGMPALVVVDTGASRTVFDAERIRELEKKQRARKHPMLSSGLGTSTMESQVLVISRLQIGSFILKNYKSILLDLSHVNQSYEQLGLSPVCGVLGSDLLKKFRARISFPQKSLRLEK
ncbi:MAG: clan AA aspartic protease [Bacteroidia bacterium]|nr:clan AA aspartic protease [Bacteroidia bacterium]